MTCLVAVYRSILQDLEAKGIEPTSENILKRLEELSKVIPEADSENYADKE